ncbi:MAG: hypothetical protein ACOYOK_11925 [Pseudobdellovibrionaceae bacterium]
MKKIILAMMLFLQTTVKANDVTLFNCLIPSDQPSATLQIDVSDDISVDFLTITLREKNKAEPTVFFHQIDKRGGFYQLLQEQKAFSFPILTEATKQNQGILQNSGFLLLQRTELQSGNDSEVIPPPSTNARKNKKLSHYKSIFAEANSDLIRPAQTQSPDTQTNSNIYYSGLLAALGNIYVLVCEQVAQAPTKPGAFSAVKP